MKKPRRQAEVEPAPNKREEGDRAVNEFLELVASLIARAHLLKYREKGPTDGKPTARDQRPA